MQRWTRQRWVAFHITKKTMLFFSFDDLRSQTLRCASATLSSKFAPFGQTLPPAVQPDFKPSAALDERQNNSCVVATLQQFSSDPPILKRKWIPTIRNKQLVPVSSIEDGEDPRKMALNGCTEPQAAPTLSWIHEEAGISCGDLQNESEGK